MIFLHPHQSLQVELTLWTFSGCHGPPRPPVSPSTRVPEAVGTIRWELGAMVQVPNKNRCLAQIRRKNMEKYEFPCMIRHSNNESVDRSLLKLRVELTRWDLPREYRIFI